ncbi:LytR/AlgR family response regulator transcription factor [Massilia eburnea]|uniref:LytR/AlgR family response regulator transcription factor n=1 Tax=Massilia eburnea TaxID=1776165 RepID=UPI003D6B5792
MAPDLILLNVQMPDGSGFDLLDALDDVPEVILTTGHGPCQADYLLKPIHPQRLAAALERAAVRTGMGKKPRRLFIRDGERCWFVRLTDIRLFEADGRHTRIYFDGGSPLIARPLSLLEEIARSAAILPRQQPPSGQPGRRRPHRTNSRRLARIERGRHGGGSRVLAIPKSMYARQRPVHPESRTT